MIFEPEFISPDELNQSLRARTPEEKLCAAILEDAIYCLRKYQRARTATYRRLYLDAEAWVMNDNSSRLFAFRAVCDALRLDPDYLRRGLLKSDEPPETETVPRAALRTTTAPIAAPMVPPSPRRPTLSGAEVLPSPLLP